RLHLGENPRRDGGGEMAEKQGFHVLPNQLSMKSAIVALQLAVAKGLEAAARGMSGVRHATHYIQPFPFGERCAGPPVGVSPPTDAKLARKRVIFRSKPL